MPRIATELGALAVSRLAEPGRHEVGGVPGLSLQITGAGARSWVLRAMVGAKRREIGLGGFPAVPLADARRRAREIREGIVAGLDPVAQRKSARSGLEAAQAKQMTFQQCAERYIEANESGWRNPKHGQQWRNTLVKYAYPVMGSMLVSDVEMAHVLKVLEPIWTTKTETASRVRARMELVLDWAKGRGHRSGDNPAAWKGKLEAQLPKAGKVAKVVHHRALDAADIGAFMVALRAMPGNGARALEFAILTAARSGEVRGATWAEIDLDAGIWTVPGERMKAGKEHRVPLSADALALLKKQAKPPEGGIVFAAPRGGMLSDMALTAVCRRLEVPAVPHGFRSTFRDWVSERTGYPGDMAEMALAHAIGNKVEAAYRRGSMFEKRRAMMEAWAKFCARVEPKGAVVPMRGAA